jgi:hypothetical protein
VPEDEDGVDAGGAASVDAGRDERGPDAAPLVRGEHRHGREAHRAQRRRPDRREEDVAHDAGVGDRDQRADGTWSQRVDQHRLGRPPEGRLVHAADVRDVARSLASNGDDAHPAAPGRRMRMRVPWPGSLSISS